MTLLTLALCTAAVALLGQIAADLRPSRPRPRRRVLVSTSAHQALYRGRLIQHFGWTPPPAKRTGPAPLPLARRAPGASRDAAGATVSSSLPGGPLGEVPTSTVELVAIGMRRWAGRTETPTDQPRELVGVA